MGNAEFDRLREQFEALLNQTPTPPPAAVVRSRGLSALLPASTA